MNDKQLSSILLASILLTILLIVGVHFLPEKRVVLIPSDRPLYLLTEKLPDGTMSSEWANESRTAWRCNYQDIPRNYFPCAWTIDLTTLSAQGNRGMNLSDYEHLVMHLDYKGTANKIRIAIRNFNPSYSTSADPNSTKFNAVNLHTKELNKENRIALTTFAVADWWLAKYNIPLSEASAELSNAMVITVDFSSEDRPAVGLNEFSIKTLELRGQWIKVEYWYLLILSAWMLGILVFAIRRLMELNAQTKHDVEVINQLSSTNEQLKEETNKFRRLSTVDPLTQLYNRFGIDQIIASLTGNAQLTAVNAPHYSLMVIDIDHFKQINDKYGHDAGDLVLQHIAKIIQSHLRAGDFVGRWGGEEFIVIMPALTKKTAMAMAEIIRDAIASAPCSFINPSSSAPVENSLTVTASFGVGERQPDEDFASCFKRADNALYKAKEQGRNRCVYAEDWLDT